MSIISKPVIRIVIWLAIFSIAMGYLETSVVVYLRTLLYPGPFPFPLQPVNPHIAVIEFWREVATILMLAGAGIIAGRNRLERFVYFLFCFGIWDIFYYVFLKVLIGWPHGLLDWDILFLVPVPWVGPVLAPCIVAFSMIVFALIVVYLHERGHSVSIKWREWLLMLTGCFVILFSFMWDYISYVTSNSGSQGLWTLGSSEGLFREAEKYIPQHYSWGVFAVGELLICVGIAWMVKRIMRSQQLNAAGNEQVVTLNLSRGDVVLKQ